MTHYARIVAIMVTSYSLGVMWGWLEHPHHPPEPTRWERPDRVAARLRAVHFLLISELTREGIHPDPPMRPISLRLLRSKPARARL